MKKLEKEIKKNFKMNRKRIIRDTIISLVLFILVLGFLNVVLAQDDSEWPAFNVCCEKTQNGAWCQNTKGENCEEGYRNTPTSCDATSFCRLGCCIDSVEGLCMRNTPQKVCEISTGSWLEDEECNVPQCELGCCVLGNEASFVTLTRCKRISRVYGLTTNFRTDVFNEAECILLAHAQDRGACVFDSEAEVTCVFTTRGECDNSKQGNISGEAKFFKDYLCSADELATNCGPTEETTCVDGKDEVYFKDSCGNPANIYDADRIYSKDPSYWQRVFNKAESCGSGRGNINSKTCGNCDYLRGSVCAKGNARYGDYYCKDLNCYKTQNGNNYRNGESWCEFTGTEKSNGLDPAGSRYFRHICIHGEEVIEPCADYRNEVCIEGEFGSSYGNFLEAACRVNRWTDCIDQKTEKSCLNEDKRDCIWVKGVRHDTELKEDEYGSGIVGGGNICLPKNPPGLEFWSDGNAKSICGLGNSQQRVEMKQSFFSAMQDWFGGEGKRKCKENCEVLETSWVDTINQVCIRLGDCGAHVNFIGKYTDEGAIWKHNGQIKSIQTGLLEQYEEEVSESLIESITSSEEGNIEDTTMSGEEITGGFQS